MSGGAARGLDARALLRWGDLDDARRRAARPRWARSPWLAPVVAAAALAALVAWLGAGGDGDGWHAASRAWLAVTIVVHCAAMLGAPARLYWRHDAIVLSRLPIAGDALFDVALVRSLRVAAHAALVSAPAALVLARADLAWAARHLGVLGALTAAAALLLPAAALGGGAMVAFGGSAEMTRATAALGLAASVAKASVGIAPQAPRGRGTEWLGALPGFAMSAIVIVVLVCVPWLDGRSETVLGPGWIVVGAAAAGAVVAAIAARRIAPGVMPAALREVIALDRQQLAHLEIHPPTALERLGARLLGAGARLVHGKDARLMRRRYPLAFVAGAVGALVLWILAAARPDGLVPWATAVAGAMALYAAALARRLGAPPIERAVTLAALPIAAADARAAKRLWYASWLVVYVGAGAAPVIARADAPALCAAAIAGAVAVAVLLGVRALAAEEG